MVVILNFNKIYYEPDALNYELGKRLKEKYGNLPWVAVESHNHIKEVQEAQNREFPLIKQNLVVGIRKTHKYTENHKISDFLVPFTSSGCSAMCLYCYLVCNFNKCSYLRLFVNREEMLEKLIKRSNGSERPLVYEIGSNSDLILENTITNNLEYTIPRFIEEGKGTLTFPTKFCMVDPLLDLNHGGRVIFRMSVNPKAYIKSIEMGTSSLEKRIGAVNKMCDAGYVCGILVAPVIIQPDWKERYTEMFDTLEATLSEKAKASLLIEIIFMTYSYVHRAINADAFPKAPDLYSRELMTVRGRGRYTYKQIARDEVSDFLKEQIAQKLPESKIVYIC